MADNTQLYGLLGQTDLYNQRVAALGVNRVWDSILENAAEYNRVANATLANFVQRTTVAQEQIELPGSGTLQPIDAYGNPMPSMPGGKYTVAYPIQGGGDAWGANRVSRAMLTVEEARRFTIDAFRKDADWLTRHALAALFTNVTWSFNDEAVGAYKGLGAITIEPLALASETTVLYPRRGGVVPAVDGHHLAQAGAIADLSNPFPTIRAELTEHPSNIGPFVSYVNGSNVAAIGALAEFVPINDPDINYGDNEQLAVNPTAPSAILGPGTEIIGKLKTSNIWVVEWPAITADYILTLALGAPAPLAMREWPAAELQGFFPENVNIDGNLWCSRMLRYAGFGARNRVSACVMRVGNGSYAVPAAYLAPLAV